MPIIPDGTCRSQAPLCSKVVWPDRTEKFTGPSSHRAAGFTIDPGSESGDARFGAGISWEAHPLSAVRTAAGSVPCRRGCLWWMHPTGRRIWGFYIRRYPLRDPMAIVIEVWTAPLGRAYVSGRRRTSSGADKDASKRDPASRGGAMSTGQVEQPPQTGAD